MFNIKDKTLRNELFGSHVWNPTKTTHSSWSFGANGTAIRYKKDEGLISHLIGRIVELEQKSKELQLRIQGLELREEANAFYPGTGEPSIILQKRKPGRPKKKVAEPILKKKAGRPKLKKQAKNGIIKP